MGDNDPKTVNERMPIYGGKLDVIGENATDDEVQREAGDVIGQDLTQGPKSDVQDAIHVYNDGLKDGPAKLDLAFKAAKAVFTKGERHVLPEDWAQLAAIFGPDMINLVKALVLLVK
jgi:hypothetical protein